MNEELGLNIKSFKTPKNFAKLLKNLKPTYFKSYFGAKNNNIRMKRRKVLVS